MRDRSSAQNDTVSSRTRTRTPSFSSSLLDSICRSIDNPIPELKKEPETQILGFYRESELAVKKQSNGGRRPRPIVKEMGSDLNPETGFFNSDGGTLFPATVKKQSNGGRRQRDDSLKRAIMRESLMEKKMGFDSNPATVFFNSGSSSSGSSSGGGTLFSSSETESTYRDKASSSGFAKTKLRALKLYGDLKKAKQPISPGRRISSFLNSIFSSAGTGAKAKMCSAGAVDDVNFECRSKTTSFSRSCLNKPGQNPKTGGAKRSVRFIPASVIADDPRLMMTSSTVMKKQSINGGIGKFFDEEEDEDDVKSCASSDLFELDHLIGKDGRYREELPVYETTSLRTNKAIAGGFIF